MNEHAFDRNPAALDQSTLTRLSFQRFPVWTQHFWTWVTGKALSGQQPLLRLNPVRYLIWDLAALAAGIAGAWWAVDRPSPLTLGIVLPLCWVVTTSASRVCSTVIAHHCIHNRFTHRKANDKLIAQFLSTLVCTEDADDYYDDHIRLHHRRETFATLADPTIQQLLELGFRPAMPVEDLWRRLAVVVVSPRFHLAFLAKRLRQNLFGRAPYRRVMSFVHLGTVLGLVAWRGAWVPFVLAVLVPLVPLYQVVALLEFLSEHAWFKAKDPGLGGRVFHVSHSWGRFNGDSLPPRGLPATASARAWARWTARLCLYHLPARILVVPGDLSQHDFHHRRPSTPDWVRAAYARQQDIDSGHEGWPAYTDIWGVGSAIAHVFAILSEEQPATWSASAVVERQEGVAA